VGCTPETTRLFVVVARIFAAPVSSVEEGVVVLKARTIVPLKLRQNLPLQIDLTLRDGPNKADRKVGGAAVRQALAIDILQQKCEPHIVTTSQILVSPWRNPQKPTKTHRNAMGTWELVGNFILTISTLNL